MKHVILFIFLIIGSSTFAQQQLDISAINSWPELHNSITNWQDGAFNVSVDPSNQNDLGWGVYNPSNHNVYGDSLYIMLLPNGEYKQLYVQDLVNGKFTFHYADIDGSNANTVVIDKDDYQGKNLGYFSFYTETIDHSLEPLSSDWDMVFMRYNRAGDHYGVAGVLTNKHVLVAESDGVDPTTVDPSTLTYNDEINIIGYDWKQFGSTGFQVVPNRAYYLIDETADTTEIIFKSFSGSSGGGVCKFTVDGTMQSITMGTGYIDRVFFDLTNGVTHTSARNGWDLAFDGTNFGTAIRTNEEIGNKLWVYPLADTTIWNGAVSTSDISKSVSFISTYPNPIENELTISIGITNEENITAHLYSIDGKLVLENHFDLSNAIQTVKLNTSSLPHGIYILHLSDSNEKQLHREKVTKF